MSQVGTQRIITNRTGPNDGARPRAAWLVMAAGGLALGGLGALGGCEVDSYFDPSQVGRFEHTPTIVPILDHIAAIDDIPHDEVETTPPTREDLIAEAQAYRIGPSDEIEVTVENFMQAQRSEPIRSIVDQRGYINFPKIGSVYVLGKNEEEVRQTIARAIREAQILDDPKVLVTVSAQRQQTFSITGGVRNPSSYFIPKPDYRILEAITAAGGMDETAQKIYVIRQVPLSDEATGRTPEPIPTTAPKPRDEAAPPLKPGELDDIINSILPKDRPGTDPAKPTGEKPAPPPAGSPGAFGGRDGTRARQPEPPPVKKKVDIDLIDSTEPHEPAKSQPESGPQVGGPKGAGGAATTQPVTNVPPPPLPMKSKTRYVFLNGQWTKDVKPAKPSVPAPPPVDPLANVNIAKDVMTQRVIEIPAQRLLAGQADVNIVIRPGDVVRVPIAESGFVYLEGSINRVSVIGLPTNSRMTLQQAIISAGGLSGIAVPERVDLTRRIGKDRQATIRLDYRAIMERTQPDVFLKADDIINIGTNFWAFPLAIFRNGLRFSYGFGFLLDRNFAGEVFGADQSISR